MSTPLCQQQATAECRTPVAAEEEEQLLPGKKTCSFSELGEDCQQGADYTEK